MAANPARQNDMFTPPLSLHHDDEEFNEDIEQLDKEVLIEHIRRYPCIGI